MALAAAAEDYFRSINPLAEKIHEDIIETKNSYENIWDTLSDKEKTEIINESLIKPEISLKYALLDALDFDLNAPPVRKDDLMSFFGRDHGARVIQDENGSYRDEHSAPFLFQTKSQLNLCVLGEHRVPKEPQPQTSTSPPTVLSELAMSHSKVVSELKFALKSHDLRKTMVLPKDESQEFDAPPGFITKFISTFKPKEDDRQCLVSVPQPQGQLVASSDNFFKTNFMSPSSDTKFQKDYRNSMVKSNSDVSEENRGLLSSHGSSDFQSCETLTEDSVPKTGYDFLDNW